VEPLTEKASRDDSRFICRSGWEASVRYAAVHALGKIGGPGVMEFLIKGLEDSDPIYQSWSIDAIEMMQSLDLRAIEALLLIKEKSGDHNLKEKASDALEFIIPTQDPKDYIDLLKHENALIRHYAVEALGELGDPCAIEPLAVLLSQEEDDRVWVSADAVWSSLYRLRRTP